MYHRDPIPKLQAYYCQLSSLSHSGFPSNAKNLAIVLYEDLAGYPPSINHVTAIHSSQRIETTEESNFHILGPQDFNKGCLPRLRNGDQRLCSWCTPVVSSALPNNEASERMSRIMKHVPRPGR